MAKFIALPFGKYNSTTNTTERDEMFVNLDRIQLIQKEQDYSCKVIFNNGKALQVYRLYDTLKAQIYGKELPVDVFPEEEVNAAFESGYYKGKMENNPGICTKEYAKSFTEHAVDWLSKNPLTDGWLARFSKEMKKFDPTKEEATEDE